MKMRVCLYHLLLRKCGEIINLSTFSVSSSNVSACECTSLYHNISVTVNRMAPPLQLVLDLHFVKAIDVEMKMMQDYMICS